MKNGNNKNYLNWQLNDKRNKRSSCYVEEIYIMPDKSKFIKKTELVILMLLFL